MKLRPCLLLVLSLICAALGLRAQDAEVALFGQVDGDGYIAPGGHYRVEIPVLWELGGDITDTPTIVTFSDIYDTHVVIASAPMDEALNAELAKRGRKDFLGGFFATYIQSQYKKLVPDMTDESAKFLPNIEGGAVLAMSLMPGGTSFADRLFLREGDKLPVAKRASLVFLKNDRVYVITTELAERVLDHREYKKTTEEEDAILRTRLLGILGKMTFRAPGQPPLQPSAAVPDAAK